MPRENMAEVASSMTPKMMLYDTSPQWLSCGRMLTHQGIHQRYDQRSARSTPLSLDSAKRESNQGRKVLVATKKSRYARDSYPERENQLFQQAERDEHECTPICSQSKLKRELGRGDLQESKRFKQDASCPPQQSDGLLEQHASNRQQVIVNAEITHVEIQGKDCGQRNEQSTTDILKELERRIQVLESLNPSLYTPLHLTRELAAINLMRLLVAFLDNDVKKEIKSMGSISLKGCTGLVAEKPFATKEDICYIKAWWFCHELLDNKAGQPIDQYWKQTVGYIPSQGELSIGSVEQDWPKRRKTAHTFELARTLSEGPLKRAENSVIKFLGTSTGINWKLLRNTCGFYCTMITPNRNEWIHLFENLFDFRGGKRKTTFHFSQSFGIDKKLDVSSVQKSKEILRDIEAFADEMEGWPLCMRRIVKWLSSGVLQKLVEAVNVP